MCFYPTGWYLIDKGMGITTTIAVDGRGVFQNGKQACCNSSQRLRTKESF